MKELADGALGDLGEDGVEGIKENHPVEVCDGHQEHQDETIKGALVPQTNTIVDPRAIVIQTINTSSTLLHSFFIQILSDPALQWCDRIFRTERHTTQTWLFKLFQKKS